MIKLLIGGSPCTYWSVAQKKGREVEAKGLGWELFKNYLIAKEKFKPDLFLYENNKSAAQPIKDQISRELGVDLMHINSALVSAQNRQRFYAFNWNVDQPADRGIMLKDILETTTSEKGYELRAPAVGVGCRNRREDDGKLYRRFETSGIPKANALTTVQTDSMVAEPIRIGTIENSAKKQSHDSKQYRVYSPEGKATTLCGEGGGLGAKTGLYAAPVRVGTMPNADGEITGGQAHRIYDASGKAVALCARPNGGGPETGLYAYPAEEAQGMAWRGRGDGSAYEARDDGKANALTASGHQSRLVVTTATGEEMPVYRSENLEYWAKAGQMLGASNESDYELLSGGSSTSVVYDLSGLSFSPQIKIEGDTDEDALIRKLRELEPEFIDFVLEALSRREGGAYVTADSRLY